MARRFLSGGFRRGSSSAVRNASMRVWVAALPSITVNAISTNFVSVIADPASFATTPGNTKHVGTLLRIRGSFSFVGSANQENMFCGIIKRDIGESTQLVNSVAFGQDEDVLTWDCFRVSNSSGPGVTNAWVIDVKAKRRFDVESELALVVATGTAVPNVVVQGCIRSLWLVP